MQRAALLLAMLLLTLTGAQAHPILQNPVWIAVSPDRVTLTLHVSVRELIVVQGLPVAEDGRVDPLEAEDFAPRHSAYLLDHFRLKADGAWLQGTVLNIKPPKVINDGMEGPDRSHFVWSVEYPLDSPPKVLSVSQTMCVEFPSSPGVPWDLSYAYRYGPHGETPWKFGVLPRDREISFNTGFVSGGPAAGTVVRTPRPATLLGLWFVFVAACMLGSTPSLRLRPALLYSVAAFAAGLAAGRYVTAAPEWALYLLCGAAAILTAADNIHRMPGVGTRRRVVLPAAGCLFFGAAFSAQERVAPELERWWHLLPLPAAIVALLTGAGIAVLAQKQNEKSARLIIQISSLICCLDAVWLMLILLEAV
jgi:hypothetical protein